MQYDSVDYRPESEQKINDGRGTGKAEARMASGKTV